jgi:N utilization substance protein B
VALQILYQADVTGRPPAEALKDMEAAGEHVPPYARDVVVGVQERLESLDAVVGQHARDWTVERMAVVDRNILRLACYELLYRPDVPDGVSISEAVEAAKELSTEESGRFVNGILGQIARDTAREV